MNAPDAVDAPVMTAAGYKRLGDIVAGDFVLTHEGIWSPVIAVVGELQDCSEVQGQSSFPITVATDTKFLGARNLGNRSQRRRLSSSEFLPASELVGERFHWSSPTTFPTQSVPPLFYGPTARVLNASVDEFWWLVGRYLADGYLTSATPPSSHKVHWVVPEHKAAALVAAIQVVGMHSHEVERLHSTANIFECSSRPLHDWLLEYCGKLAGGKKVPPFALALQTSHRRALLEGYLVGDGWFASNRGRWEAGSASKALVSGVQLLAQSLGYTVNCSSVLPHVTEILGVRLKQAPQVSWRVQLGHGLPIARDGVLLSRVKSARPVGVQIAVKLVVADGNSFLIGSVFARSG